VTLRASVSNTGPVPATTVRICFTAKTRSLVRGRSKVCRTVASIEAGKSVSLSQKFRTKKGKKGKRVRFEVSAEYVPTPGAAAKKTYVGHVTLMR
jgi:hypothetical protein